MKVLLTIAVVLGMLMLSTCVRLTIPAGVCTTAPLLAAIVCAGIYGIKRIWGLVYTAESSTDVPAAELSRKESDRTPLHSAAARGYRDVVEHLIKEGDDVNARDGKGFAPLHSAAANAHLDIVELLIQNGADVNIRNQAGITPVQLALKAGHQSVVALLKKHGAKEQDT